MTTAAMLPLVDIKEVQHSLTILLDQNQVVELRALDATSQSSNKYQKPYTASGYFNDPAILVKELSTLKSATGIYITLQPCKPDLIARAQNRLRTASEMNSKKNSATADNHITGYRWLLIDIDQDETIRPAGISASDSEHEAALARCQEIAEILHTRFDWPEPVIADSGNGGHLLYRIDLAISDAALVKRVLIGLAGLFDTEQLHIDQTVYNPARICKLYGTLACKGDNINDRPHRMSKLLAIPEQIAVVPRKMLEAMAAPEQPKATQRNSKEWADFNLEIWIQDHRLDVIGSTPWNGGDKWVFPVCPWNGEHTDRSAFILRFPNGAIAAGCHHNGCSGLDWKALRTKYEPDAYERKQKPKISTQDINEKMYRILAGEELSTRPTQATNGHTPQLPEVIIGGQLRDTTRQALNALAQMEAQHRTIFVQSGSYSLVRIARDKDGRPAIKPMGVPEIKLAMTRSGDYFTIRINKSTGDTEYLNTSPPKEVAEQILSLPPTDWPFPLLDAIVEIPQLRSDGTILSQPGYDEQTKLYYMPQKNLVIPDIPIFPTRADIDQAATFIRGFLGDFPWVSPTADLANACGLWLTTIVRQMVRHVPLALLNATAPGTGKGLLTDATALLATGKTSSSVAQVSSDEEWDKRITALLMAGTTMISIDNVEGILRSSILSKALTSDYHNGRILGFSKMTDIPQRATWIANGNNIQLGGDMPRRCYPINMALQVSDPWTRENFKYPDLIKAIKAHRGEIIAALLTIARAWFAAGQPTPTKKLGKLATFSEWVDLVGGILSYAGIDGFLENLTEMHQKADVEGKAWALFLKTWLEKLGKNEYTTKVLIEEWKKDSELAETLPDPIATWFQDEAKTIKNKVGKLLAKKEGRPYGTENLRIVKGENTDAKVATYKVTGYTGYTGDKSSLHTVEKSSLYQAEKEGRGDIEHGAKDTTYTTYTPYPMTGINRDFICVNCGYDDYTVDGDLFLCAQCGYSVVAQQECEVKS